MSFSDWPGLDTTKPSAARISDYLLGGNYNFAADRNAAEEILGVFPDAGRIAAVGRAFRHRAVRHLNERGIRQFLDIGCGVVASEPGINRDPALTGHVVYVDLDPIVVAHAILELRPAENATAIQVDLRYPDHIFCHDGVRTHLDLAKPVGLLLTSVLHFYPNHEAYPAVERLRAALAPGSYIVVSHPVFATRSEDVDRLWEVYRRTTMPDIVSRSSDEIEAFFGDYQPVPPGLVATSQWMPDTGGASVPGELIGGIARKPE